MKKIFAMVFVLSLCLCLVGCTVSDIEEQIDKTVSENNIVITPDELPVVTPLELDGVIVTPSQIITGTDNDKIPDSTIENIPSEIPDDKIENIPDEIPDEKINEIEAWSYDIDYSTEVQEGEVIDSLSLSLTENNGEYTVSGENLEYLNYMKLGQFSSDGQFTFAFSIYQRVNAETWQFESRVLSESVNIDKEYNVLKEDTVFSNEHIKAVVNGESVRVSSVKEGAGNGHTDYYIHFDCKMAQEDFESFNITIE